MEYKEISATEIVGMHQDIIKKQIYETSKKIDRVIKEAALKGFNVLVIKTTNALFEKVEGGATYKQSIKFYPMDSMEEAQEVFKGNEYRYIDLDLVREYMEFEKVKKKLQEPLMKGWE